jgi:hypothetical protein
MPVGIVLRNPAAPGLRGNQADGLGGHTGDDERRLRASLRHADVVTGLDGGSLSFKGEGSGCDVAEFPNG